MSKKRILEELHRMAEANGGLPPGKKRFESETGITEAEWSGRYWARWSDAVREAGFLPNSMNAALENAELLDPLAQLTRELQRFPVTAELRLRRQNDPNFPNHKSFDRFGPKTEKVRALRVFAQERDYQDVVDICSRLLPPTNTDSTPETEAEDQLGVGFVYLLKHGARGEYKIGRTNNLLRRNGEIRLETPEPVAPIHTIKTDDPAGVEAYWHRRFNQKRLNGEWFALTAQDVKAFRRWKKLW